MRCVQNRGDKLGFVTLCDAQHQHLVLLANAVHIEMFESDVLRNRQAGRICAVRLCVEQDVTEMGRDNRGIWQKTRQKGKEGTRGEHQQKYASTYMYTRCALEPASHTHIMRHIKHKRTLEHTRHADACLGARRPHMHMHS